MRCIVERVIHKELQFWNDAQLMAHAVSQFKTHLLLVGVHILNDFIGLLTGEHTQIHPTYAHVGTDATGTDTHQHTMHAACLPYKYLTEFLLYQSGYLILSCAIHNL